MLTKLRKADAIVHVHAFYTALVMWLYACVSLWPYNGAGVLYVYLALSLFLDA